MGKNLSDGSVISSFFDVENQMDTGTKDEFKIIEGQILKIHFVDDISNRSKVYVEYDVLARDAHGSASTYQNCKNIMDFGGSNNYTECVLEANEAALQGKLTTANFASNMNGTLVKLAFLENLDRPIIIGGEIHKRIGGATRKDGIRQLSEFNGIKTEINKDGEFIITAIGPKSSDGKLLRKDTGPTSIKIDKKGDFEFKQEKNVNILNSEKFERDVKKVTRNIGTLGEIWDGIADKKSFTTEGGLTIEYNGASDKVTYTTSGGAVVTINGGGDITLDFNGTLIKISAGKIELTGAAVDVGEAASALAALGPQLVSWAASHTHLHPTPLHVAGSAPTSPPVVPPPASVLSTSVKIKP